MSEAIATPETRTREAELLADRYVALWNEPDPERDAVRLDRRHHATTVAMTPSHVRNDWTVKYIA